MEDKIKELLHANNHKEKNNTHEYNVQEFWAQSKDQCKNSQVERRS
jgi:hypothetical protein